MTAKANAQKKRRHAPHHPCSTAAPSGGSVIAEPSVFSGQLLACPEKRRMTVIAAFRESEDSLLIVADTGATDDEVRVQSQQKLHALAWPLPAVWSDFRDQVRDELTRLNRAARQRARNAGVKPTVNDVCHVLIAAWPERGPDMFTVDDRGALTPRLGDGFGFIGSGRVHAHVAYETLRRVYGSQPVPGSALLAAVEIGAQMAPGCDPPVAALRIKPSGVEPVR